MIAVRGETSEPSTVKVKPSTSGTWKDARMLEGNRFESDLDLITGANQINVEAKDTSNNTSNYTYGLNLAAAAAASPTYGDDGNLLSAGVQSYQWERSSRLVKISWRAGSNKATEYRYNGLGQRSEQIEKTGTTETARYYYLYEGIQLLCRYTGGTAEANVDRQYLSQGEQRKSGSTWSSYYYNRDHLGSIREVMNSDGTLAARYDYDPYGKRLTQYQASGYSGGCDLGYTGHITQQSAVAMQGEIVLTRFRAYDPEMGRWLSADPLGEAGGMNLYAYCYGNPLNLYDPDGMWPARPEWMLTNAEIGDALNDGFFATLDGAIPFADPFADAGKYGRCESGVGVSQAAGGIARDAAFAAATGGAAFARGGASRVLAGQAKSGIYQFGTKAGQYVGQSGNIAARIAQHGSRVAGNVSQWAVRGGKTAREIAEFSRIRQLGGIDNLANIKNPLGLARQFLADGYITADTAAAHGAAGGALLHALDGATGNNCKN